MAKLNSQVKWITGRRILYQGQLRELSIRIDDNGKIAEILESGLDKADNRGTILDVGDLVVMPGLVDSHVHVNEPGRTEWEGYWTATRAAAAGGITTIVDMPLNSHPPTTTVSNFEIKLSAAEGKCHVDVGFWGGVVPSNLDELKPLMAKGVIGFKCFLIHSGIDDFPSVTEDQVDHALGEMSGSGKVLAFHAEVENCCGTTTPKRNDNDEEYETFLRSRPDKMEVKAVQMVDKLCRKHKNIKCHIVHVSSSECFPTIAKLKEDGFPLTIETCPHYLTLTAEQVQNNRTEFKCCPPIRSLENQTKLWKGVQSGLVDMIVSDHSPCTVDLKQPGTMNFAEAWGGISSVQFGLPLIWTKMKEDEIQESNLSSKLSKICRLMSENPARLAGVDSRKGQIQIGFDADFVIWNPEAQFMITEDLMQFRNKVTPYAGVTLNGVVRLTILRGTIIYNTDDKSLFAPPSGLFLLNA